MSKIKILYVQETVGRGGVEKRKLAVAKLLDKSKYDIKLICTVANVEMIKEFENEGVEIIKIGKLKNLLHFAKYKKVLKVIKAYRPHIIHGAVFEGVALACVTGKIGAVPIVIAEETSDPKNRTAKASLLLRLLTRAADRVVAIAPAVGDYLRDIAKIPEKKIHVINNGVEKPRTVSLTERDKLKEHYQIKPYEFVIGSVGRLQNDHKRFSDILEAVSLLPNKKNVKVLIVGGGKDALLLENIAVQLGLFEQLVMVGHQQDTAPFYSIMDVFCLASQREGFGLVAAEAMMHALPVIASKVGGLQNIVMEGITGYLTPPKDPVAVAEKLQLLINNGTLRKELGDNGYHRALQEYTAEVYVAKIQNLYETILKEKGLYGD
jgi:glycosyltransferase involved in cell wall biosynthesis